MARYINEDEFIAWVKEHWCADCQNDNGLRCRACWIDDAIDIVEEAPEVDVVPRTELAREIFEEIERYLEYNARRGDAFVDTYFDSDLSNDIAELKKKYTEGAADDGGKQ
jgi:hypothetical protein